jgi:hypothetical protein
LRQWQQDKIVSFTILLLLLSLLKLLPILLLGLLLMTDHRWRVLSLLATGASFALLLLMQYVLAPDLFTAFISININYHLANGVAARGLIHPSTLTFLYSIYEVVRATTGANIPPWSVRGCHIALSLWILGLTW